MTQGHSASQQPVTARAAGGWLSPMSHWWRPCCFSGAASKTQLQCHQKQPGRRGVGLLNSGQKEPLFCVLFWSCQYPSFAAPTPSIYPFPNGMSNPSAPSPSISAVLVKRIWAPGTLLWIQVALYSVWALQGRLIYQVAFLLPSWNKMSGKVGECMAWLQPATPNTHCFHYLEIFLFYHSKNQEVPQRKDTRCLLAGHKITTAAQVSSLLSQSPPNSTTNQQNTPKIPVNKRALWELWRWLTW